MGKSTHILTVFLVAGILSFTVFSSAGEKNKAPSLGIGVYDIYCGGDWLDLYRQLDFSLVKIGPSAGLPAGLMRIIEAIRKENPRHEIIAQINFWQGAPGRKCSFLDYRYDDKAKKTTIDCLKKQTEAVSLISGIHCVTFAEELPDVSSFSCWMFNKEMPAPVVRWAVEMEKERGKKTEWNQETKDWLMDKFIEIMNEFYAVSKSVNPQLKVYQWIRMPDPKEQLPRFRLDGIICLDYPLCAESPSQKTEDFLNFCREKKTPYIPCGNALETMIFTPRHKETMEKLLSLAPPPEGILLFHFSNGFIDKVGRAVEDYRSLTGGKKRE